MNFLKEKPSIVVQAQKAKFNPNIVVQFILFFVVFFVSQFAASIVAILATYPQMMKDYVNKGIDSKDIKAVTEFTTQFYTSSNFLLVSLVCTLIATALVIIYCRFIEKRSLYSMGFVSKKAVPDYLIGMVIGFVMFSVAILICVATGTLSYKGAAYSGSIGLIVSFFLGYLFQGMSEEVVCRGYFMTTVASKKPLILAILANSVLFGLMHLMNKGVSVLAIVNIVLVGIFLSVFMLKSDSIWGVCALHSIWNFTQGNFYGIKVSGIDSGASVFKFVPTNGGTLLNGGEFGLEGGLAVTIVLVLGIAVTLLWKGKQSEMAGMVEETIQPYQPDQRYAEQIYTQQIPAEQIPDEQVTNEKNDTSEK